MKMQNEIIEKLTTIGESSYAAMQELGAINTNLLKQVTDLQLNFATMSIESGVEQAKLLSGTTNYKDILSAQADFASDYSNKVIDFSHQTADVITGARSEVVALFEKNIESATVTVKPKTKRNTKKATS
jgi:phasin family protein